LTTPPDDEFDITLISPNMTGDPEDSEDEDDDDDEEEITQLRTRNTAQSGARNVLEPDEV
jgi:hypothetical protein